MAEKRKTRAEDPETAVRVVVSALRRSKIPYMLIGALALPVWGRPRATLDVDFMIPSEDVPKKLIDRLAKFGFDLDVEWEQRNPSLM
jgi:hypothetical protein